MNVGAKEGAPGYVRWACLATIVFLFALPCIVGRLTTYFVLLFGIFALITPSLLAAFESRVRNPIDLMFVAAAALPSLAFLFTSEEPRDLLFAFNFAPLLLAIPFRWQLARFARADAAMIIAWLSLTGAAIATLVALIQVGVLGQSRAGQPLMSVFHFADTAMLLGFVALVGFFAPGRHARLPFLIGPFLGIAVAILSGTRGALIAAPVLGVVALGFALVRSRNRGPILAAAAGFVLISAMILFVAAQLGLGRALDGFLATKEALAGEQVDNSTLERLTMFWGGYQAFLHSPLVGYGWLDMVPAILPHVDPADVERMRGFRQLHNGLLSFAVGAGIPGIISFVILSVAPVIAVFRTPRDALFVSRLYLAVTLCVGYAVFQLTIIMIGFEFHTVQYAFMTMVILSFVAAPVEVRAPIQSSRGRAAVGPETASTA